MFRNVKDKFGNPLFPHTLSRYREHLEHYDVGNKRLRFVADPEEEHDSVNRRFLDRFYVRREEIDELVNRVNVLESVLSQNKTVIDAMKSELVSAQESIKQSLTYDGDMVKFNGKEFKLLINDPKRPFIVADPKLFSGLAVYGGENLEYRPRHLVYWAHGLQITSIGSKFVWDQEHKRIYPLLDGTQSQHAPPTHKLFEQVDSAKYLEQ